MRQSFSLRLIVLFLTVALGACTATKPALETSPATFPAATAAQTFWLGTYTQGVSEGIYRWELSPAGILARRGLGAAAKNPSFLAYGAGRKTLLTVNETDYEGVGGVQSFRISGDSLLLLSTQSSGGANPCHVTADADGHVVVSNYTGGNVSLYQLDAAGALSGILATQPHPGDAGETPHAHFAHFDPLSGLVLAVDLGTADLFLSDIRDQRLVPSSPDRLPLEQGAGPRHLAMHPNGKWLYVINEYANTVTLVERGKKGAFAKRASYSTLPAGFAGESFCADIHVSADGRFVYGSNRGANTIVAFAIDGKSGALTAIDQESVHGDWPRNFALSPDGRFVVVANQRSNNLAVLRRDPATGLLDFVSETTAPAPVCVLF